MNSFTNSSGWLIYAIVFLFVCFFRECLQPAGDDCVAPPATFFVVDETSEKSRKGKKNTRYNFFPLLSSFQNLLIFMMESGEKGGCCNMIY